MGIESIVYGYIQVYDRNDVSDTLKYISEYSFDEVYPFTNVFNNPSRADYFSPIIVFGGSYKQIEEHWSEYLWKFAQFMKGINAFCAVVNLDCVIGNHSWSLRPKNQGKKPFSLKKYDSIGSEWVIVDWPVKDFSIDPDWYAGQTQQTQHDMIQKFAVERIRPN